MKKLDPFQLPSRSKNPIAKVAEIAYLRLERKNLKLSKEFYVDFGFRIFEETTGRVLLGPHGFDYPCLSLELGSNNECVGLGFFINNVKEWNALSKVQNAKTLDNGLWGKAPVVRLQDPSEMDVDVVLSDIWKTIKNLEPTQIPINKIGSQGRLNQGYPTLISKVKILRLGHSVFQRLEFQKNIEWYTNTLGLIPSDVQILAKSKTPVLSFLRCDREAEPTDHHTIVLAQGLGDELEHFASELPNMDFVAKGREYVLSKGWKASWGIGRHALGSQVFDYLRDPTGLLAEHYADGDRFDSSVPVGVHPVSRSGLYIWGQDHPQNFISTKPSIHKIVNLVLSIFKGKDISLRTLLELKSSIDASPRKWIKY